MTPTVLMKRQTAVQPQRVKEQDHWECAGAVDVDITLKAMDVSQYSRLLKTTLLSSKPASARVTHATPAKTKQPQQALVHHEHKTAMRDSTTDTHAPPWQARRSAVSWRVYNHNARTETDLAPPLKTSCVRSISGAGVERCRTTSHTAAQIRVVDFCYLQQRQLDHLFMRILVNCRSSTRPQKQKNSTTCTTHDRVNVYAAASPTPSTLTSVMSLFTSSSSSSSSDAVHPPCRPCGS